jgi:hypothetical protein
MKKYLHNYSENFEITHYFVKQRIAIYKHLIVLQDLIQIENSETKI